MQVAEATKITVDEYRRLPESGPRYQLIDGTLHMAPAPNRYHQDISRNLGFLLLKYLEETPIGVVYFAPFDVVFSDHDVFQPDIVFVSDERRSILDDAGATGAPDFVAEALSPSNARLDRRDKKAVYAQCGVKELWIVDPSAREIEVFMLQEDVDAPTVVFGNADEVTSSCFPGMTLHAAEIFRH